MRQDSTATQCTWHILHVRVVRDLSLVALAKLGEVIDRILQYAKSLHSVDELDGETIRIDLDYTQARDAVSYIEHILQSGMAFPRALVIHLLH